MASRRSRRGERGFTLLELLVTMGVTVIGLAGLLALHVTTLRGNDVAGRSGEAISLAQQQLEALRDSTIKDLLDNLGNGDEVDRDLDTVAGRGGMTYRPHVIVEPLPEASADLYRVRVEMSWTDDGAAEGAENGVHDHTVSLEIIRTKQELL
jgi:type IV pilus assembly protein PilV